MRYSILDGLGRVGKTRSILSSIRRDISCVTLFLVVLCILLQRRFDGDGDGNGNFLRPRKITLFFNSLKNTDVLWLSSPLHSTLEEANSFEPVLIEKKRIPGLKFPRSRMETVGRLLPKG